ncbi:MAG: hypothetical protein QGG90_08265, partial [Nitrospinota bacterium]|nr:hypothetical protein [Nitrospinota bacterium]
YRTGPSASWSKIISALPLLLVGAYLFLKEVRPFDLFRYAVGAVVVPDRDHLVAVQKLIPEGVSLLGQS